MSDHQAVKSFRSRAENAVAAIVVTYQRPHLVVETIKSLISQSSPVRHIVVVDNSSNGTTAEAIDNAGLADSVVLLPRHENEGFEGGLASGIAFCAEEFHPDWYWLLDDDSPVDIDSLRDGLAELERLPDRSVLANRGATLPRGRVQPVYGHSLAEPVEVDVCLFDGTLYPCSAVEAVGAPRADFFLMFGDYEYALRLRRAGFHLYVGPSVRSSAGYSGFGSSPPWRGYYQTRNQFRTAIEMRSPTLLFGALDRVTRQVGHLLVHHPERYRVRIRLRLIGIWHAMIGRMGRVVEPSDPRYR